MTRHKPASFLALSLIAQKCGTILFMRINYLRNYDRDVTVLRTALGRVALAVEFMASAIVGRSRG